MDRVRVPSQNSKDGAKTPITGNPLFSLFFFKFHFSGGLSSGGTSHLKEGQRYGFKILFSM